MNRKRSKAKIDRKMPMVHPNAAAVDVGATMHMAAVRADRTPEPVRSFGTFTTDLHRLVDWFTENGVETVVMESTSVYWIPIFELLDARGFTVFLVNARDAKHVPGRKTDVSDAQWLQRLHSYGLLRASFRPKGQIAELRAYVRQRERLLEYAASHIQHMQKALTEMNLQLHHVVADITGATGLRIIARFSPANMTPRCWRACAITDATPARRRSRRRSLGATAPSTCLRWSRHSPSTTLTTRRCRPATPGSKPS
jgi:transposase